MIEEAKEINNKENIECNINYDKILKICDSNRSWHRTYTSNGYGSYFKVEDEISNIWYFQKFITRGLKEKRVLKMEESRLRIHIKGISPLKVEFESIDGSNVFSVNSASFENFKEFKEIEKEELTKEEFENYCMYTYSLILKALNEIEKEKSKEKEKSEMEI